MPARAEETRSGPPGKCGALFWGEETQRKERAAPQAARRGFWSVRRRGRGGPRRAELYREQAEELRLARAERAEKRGGGGKPPPYRENRRKGPGPDGSGQIGAVGKESGASGMPRPTEDERAARQGCRRPTGDERAAHQGCRALRRTRKRCAGDAAPYGGRESGAPGMPHPYGGRESGASGIRRPTGDERAAHQGCRRPTGDERAAHQGCRALRGTREQRAGG